jgi:hypothetical protein
MVEESNSQSATSSDLRNEYKQLSSAAENLVSNSFQVPAVAIAVVTALAVSGNVKATYWGFGIMTGVFLLSVWLGYYHSTLNTYGLQLVKLETTINKQGLPGKLTYYTDHVGKPPLGANAYASMLAILVIASMLFSGWNIWTTMRAWGWGILSSVICIIIFTTPTLICFANMGLTERAVRRKKAMFISM